MKKFIKNLMTIVLSIVIICFICSFLVSTHSIDFESNKVFEESSFDELKEKMLEDYKNFELNNDCTDIGFYNV